MGCDIHFFVERYSDDRKYSGPRNTIEERNDNINAILENTRIKKNNVRWITADKWVYHKGNEFESAYWDIPNDKKFYRGRNYGLFMILADVINCDNSLKPIASPRGIPEDASYAYRVEVEHNKDDGHSHSYFTLQELQDVDWTQYPIDYVGEFLKTLDKMAKVDDDPSKVRCCFYFDN